jgi:hypothetical protein
MNNIRKNIYYLFIAFIAICSYSVIFIDIYKTGINDFDFHMAYNLVASKSFFQNFEFPLWNPYDHGGTPFLAQAYSTALSPFLLLNTIFEPIVAVKLKILIFIYMCGAFSFVFFRSILGNSQAALLGSVVYTFSSYFALNITQGQYEFMSGVYVPLLFMTYNKSSIRERFIFALATTLMLFEGGVYNIVITAVGLGLCSLYSFRSSFKNLVINFSISALLGMIKLLPAVELIASKNRKIHDVSGYSVWSLIHSLINPDQFITYRTNNEPFFDYISKYIGLDSSFGFMKGMDTRWDEYGMYIGIFVLALSLLGLIYAVVRKKYFPFITVFFVSLILSFGMRLPYSLWGVLNNFPIFENMRHPMRFRILILLMLSFFAAYLLKNILDYLNNKYQKISWKYISALMVATIAANYISVNQSVLSDAFVIEPFRNIEPAQEFHYIKSWQKDPFYYETTEEGYYPAFLSNQGLVFKKETQEMKIATKAKDDKDYIAEAYLRSTSTPVEILKRTNNSVIFNLHSIAPDHEIIFNQNYFNGWKSHDCIVDNYEGLIRLKGCRGSVVKISYTPTTFIVGALISFITFFVLLFQLSKAINILDVRRIILKFR